MRLFHMFKLSAALAVGALGACAPAQTPDKLSASDFAFLFAGDGKTAPFFGEPQMGVALSCSPAIMNKAFVFVHNKSSYWLDSVRPSGVERHKILAIVADGDQYEVKAQNGITVPFDLIITRHGPDRATISWDGAPAQDYRRCERSAAG